MEDGSLDPEKARDMVKALSIRNFSLHTGGRKMLDDNIK